MSIITTSPVDPGSIDPWYTRPMDQVAQFDGELGVDGHPYKKGEVMPFYVPRPVMPQIEHHDINRLIHFVRVNGVWIRRKIFHPSELRNHQEIKWDRTRWDPTHADQPIWVASDRFILDGNHRWYGHLKMSSDVHAIQIGLEFEPAVALLFKFPKTTAGQQ